MWCTHTVECYLALIKIKTLPFATTWMNLEGTTETLSETSCLEKNRQCRAHLCEASKRVKLIEAESRTVVAWRLTGKGSRELFFKGLTLLLFKVNNF